MCACSAGHLVREQNPFHLESSATGGVGIIGERAKRARHYQGCTNSSCCGICVYIYIYGGTCSIIVAHATYT